MPAISLRLPEDIEARLTEEARLEGCARSEVVREAIAEYLARRERERFMAEMVAEARRAYSDPAIRREAQEMAEEAIVTGNEAMDIAEGREPGEPWPEETGEKWWR
ncbi:MAG: CopG family transcriptional regulator [Azoarcus sp.]|nr:CopG family transcriptional regulator [Azoarcus sp.]